MRDEGGGREDEGGEIEGGVGVSISNIYLLYIYRKVSVWYYVVQDIIRDT